MIDWEGYLRQRLDLPAMRQVKDERMIQELADHLEDLYREATIRGATEEEARALVLRKLGDLELATGELTGAEPAHGREQVNRWLEGREVKLWNSGGRWIRVADAARDLRLSLRSLARRPLFTTVVVLVLALGIGATTTIFTLLDAIVLSSLPFDEPDQLVSVSHTAPSRGLADAGQCAAWHFTYEDESRVFQDLGMYSGGSVAVSGEGDPEAVPALFVTSGVFRALRLNPVVGRRFTPADEEPGAPASMLLSHRYWQTRFGGDRNVLGRTVRVDGATWEVAGVMPPMLQSLEQDPALIFPLRFNRSELFVGNIGLDAVGRLQPGVTLEQASSDLGRVLPMAWEKFPGGPVAGSDSPAQYTPVVQPLQDRLTGSVSNLLWILQGGVGVVLLIACANVANLFLIRAEGRASEVAVRTALGASGYRIGWEYSRESLTLGFLGGVGGLMLASGGLEFLKAMGPSQLPRLQNASLNGTVLFFTFAVSLLIGVIFGLFPVLKRNRSSLGDALKQGSSRGMPGRRRNWIQNALAVSQMALALVLLVASGLMLRSVQALSEVDPGFQDPEAILALRLFIPMSEIEDPEETARTFEAIARRLEEVAGVTSVGVATAIPMDGSLNYNPFHVEGSSPPEDGPPPSRRHKWIGENYFETLRISLLAGRTFTWEDVHNRLPAAIVSESLAREYWGSPEAALGKRVSSRPEPVRWHEVVGVVANVRDDGVDQHPPLMVYWPQVTLAFWEGSPADQVQVWRSMGYAIRSLRAGTPGFLEDVRQAIWEVSPNLPLRGMQPLTDLMARSVSRTSFTTTLLGIATAVALLLGVVGVYGVISYTVTQRTRELGMRMVLGARARDVKGMVVKQGLILSLTGVGIGLALALGLTRLMTGLLFGVSSSDPVTFGAVAVGLTLVALTATYLPARRAAGVDPIKAVRSE